MKTLLLWLAISFLVHPSPSEIDRGEAKRAFQLLNRMCINPSAFTAEMPFLAETEKRPALQSNDTLAAAAEAKALDMATRNYFGHTDPDGYGMNYFINKVGYTLNSKWLTRKDMNFFESLSAGAASGEAAIRNLVIDKNVPSLGHRKHLLGLDEWNASLYDIGIGYARPNGKSAYLSYVCVIIAKHNCHLNLSL